MLLERCQERQRAPRLRQIRTFFTSFDVAQILGMTFARVILFRMSDKSGVFISHITEEKPVAAVLRKYLALAFGDDLRVFVSTDPVSISGGQKWFNHIIDNLRLSKVVLVLVSQESRRREWTNFEAGYGDGDECLVIPIGIKNFPLAQMSFPLAGFQGRPVQEVTAWLDDIGNYLGKQAEQVDVTSFVDEINRAEAQLVYKSLKVEPTIQGQKLCFDITNIGNVDLELLMLETLIPYSAVDMTRLSVMSMYFDYNVRVVDGVNYVWLGVYSPRGVYKRYVPLLQPVLTPSMGTVRLEIDAWKGLSPEGAGPLPMHFKIHALGYNTELEKRIIRPLEGLCA